jgi:hypothetical protein
VAVDEDQGNQRDNRLPGRDGAFVLICEEGCHVIDPRRLNYSVQ